MNPLEPRRRAVICDPPAVLGVATLLWHLGGITYHYSFSSAHGGSFTYRPPNVGTIFCTNHLVKGVSPLLYISIKYLSLKSSPFTSRIPNLNVRFQILSTAARRVSVVRMWDCPWGLWWHGAGPPEAPETRRSERGRPRPSPGHSPQSRHIGCNTDWRVTGDTERIPSDIQSGFVKRQGEERGTEPF